MPVATLVISTCFSFDMFSLSGLSAGCFRLEGTYVQLHLLSLEYLVREADTVEVSQLQLLASS